MDIIISRTPKWKKIWYEKNSAVFLSLILYFYREIWKEDYALKFILLDRFSVPGHGLKPR